MSAPDTQGDFNVLQGIFEPGGALHSLASSENLATAEQLGLFLTLHKVEHAETFYRHVVGLRLANQLMAGLQTASDPNEALRAQTLLSIADFVKANPRCREDELRAEILKHIEAFAQAVQ